MRISTPCIRIRILKRCERGCRTVSVSVTARDFFRRQYHCITNFLICRPLFVPWKTAPNLASPRRRLTVGFCFADRDFPTASPEIYAILCSCKGTQAESAYAESAQESTLRGLRREVRFIMSPPGKRRHNELNAAPPPENPRGTGKTGEASD